jgi:hypothetical protein
MGYKSVRLLNEALHKEMGELRKLLMSETTPQKVTDDGQTAVETLNLIRDLFNELAAFADRPTIAEVVNLPAGEYVATMKPLVTRFNQQLMVANAFAPMVCESLQANGCIVILMGDGKTIVRTAHDPNRPEVALAMEALLAAIDSGTKQVLEEGAKQVESDMNLPPMTEGEKDPGNGVGYCSGSHDNAPCGADDCYVRAATPPMGGSPDEEDAKLADLKNPEEFDK